MAYPVIIKDSPHMMEFMKRYSEFSDLEPMETDESVIEISSRKKRRLAALKEEMQKVTCQSYILNDNQYEGLSEAKKDLLLEVENKFDVKGSLYEYTRMADIPVIFQVNPLTCISCVVSSDPESILVDSLISIDWQKSKSDDREIMHDKIDNYRILEYESWNIPMNHHLGIIAPRILNKKTYSWNVIIEHCLEIVLKNDPVSHTIGISIPAEIYEDLGNFSQSVLTIVQNLPQNHERPIYILLFVQTDRMKLKVVTILKKISDSKPDVHSSQAISSNSKGAIPQIRSELSNPIEQNLPLKYGYNALQWIQFLNYSAKRETLDKAINHFEKYLLANSSDYPYSFSQGNEEHSESLYSQYDMLNCHKNISVSFTELQDLLLLYDFPSLMTDIKMQMDSMMNSLLIPASYADQFERNLTELRTLCDIDTLPIPSDMESSQLQHYLVKIQQQYPPIKCVITNNVKDVYFRGLNFENIQGAKCQLESFFGLRENVSVSQYRYNEKETEPPFSSDYKPEEFEVASGTVPSYNKPEVKYMYPPIPPYHKPEYKSVYSTVPSYHKSEEVTNEYVNIPYRQERISTLATDSQNNKDTQDTDCFPIEDGFLVKVYQGDILTANVEGIVNAANKYLSHGGGLAYAIIKAAGDVVNKEVRDKLSGRILNDGDVLSTSAGNLKQYKCIIHAVGPMYSLINRDDYCRITVAETVCNSLKEASKLGLFSVALPAISSAIFAVPIDVCVNGYFMGVMEFCKTKPASCQLKEVHFVDLNQTICNAIKNYFANKLGNNIF